MVIPTPILLLYNSYPKPGYAGGVSDTNKLIHEVIG